MAYRFEPDESVGDATVRCAGEQLDRAIVELTDRITDEPVQAVHAARKAIKRERALLRLGRGSIPAKQRRRENDALREVARGLSSARDSEAMTDTLRKLAERYAGQLPESSFEDVREELEKTRDRQRAELLDSALGARAVQDLRAVRLRVDDWTFRRDGWRAIEKGIGRAYRDGSHAFASARSQRSLETWHAWRKRAKDLWYQQRLLSMVAGPMVGAQAKDAHLLADLLGDDHDLGVLRGALTRDPVHSLVDADAVTALIDHRRNELQAEALVIGARVYAETPKAFMRRMRRSWKAGCRLAEAAAARDPAELAEATRTT